MKRKRRICIFVVALVLTVAQGSIWAAERDTETLVEVVTETTTESAEGGKNLQTKNLINTVKEKNHWLRTDENVSDTGQVITDINKEISNQNTQEKKPIKKTADGQTLLDVKEGNITITDTGASVGTSSETSLNPKGYRITGTTTTNCITVESGVTTDITLDNVSVTSNSGNKSCMDISHANVTITLVGDNLLSCGIQNYGALVKNGMDDTKLVIQCEHADETGHKCQQQTCGTLEARGTVMHSTAIGNIIAKRTIAQEAGFSNLTVKGGLITAKAGAHNCAIGAACGSYVYGFNGVGTKKYAKNIRIEGGVVKAMGGDNCAGIGGGKVTPVDGIYITGGTVYASGGSYSPGIGSGGTGVTDAANFQVVQQYCYNASNIVISGGDTLVRAVGDKSTDMPGIGCGKAGNVTVGTAENVSAEPDTGYQGYIQDGTSETEYEFTKESPFQDKQDIKVDKYFTMVYFGPFRDENKINADSKEQMGANHVISKTGGEEFTEEQIKELTKANGKDKDGNPFEMDDFTLPDRDQINAINEAKKKGEIGNYLLTIATENGTQVTITVFLRENGTDVTAPDKPAVTGMVGANNVEKETGGKEFEEDEIKELCDVKGKDKDGNNLKLKDFQIDKEQLKTINEAKTSKNVGKFPLTYETPDGKKVEVEIILTGTVEISFDTNGGSQAPEMQSTDSGKTVQKPDDPEKDGYGFEGWYYTDEEGNEFEWNFEDPVYENMTLKAKWKEELRSTEATTEKSEPTTEKFEPTTEMSPSTERKEDTTMKKQSPKWEYKKRRKQKTKVVTQTGDTADILFLIILLGVSAAGAGFLLKIK